MKQLCQQIPIETKFGLLVFEILAVNEAAVPTNTNKETKFGLLVFTGR